MVKNFTTMMEGSLGLVEPWYVERAEFSEEKQRIDIYVAVHEPASFVCPVCGGPVVRDGYEPNEREWRHGDCMFFPTYVHCRRPRVKCPKCGVCQINAPFERKGSRFTTYFEGYAMMLMADMPRAKAAKLLRCDEKSMAGILAYWVGKAVDERTLENIARIAIDETSFKRGHSYVTVTVDADRRRVIDVEEGRDKDAVKKFCEKLEAKNGDPGRILAVTSDMSKSFCPAIKEKFKNAAHIIDKFHVKQTITNAMDEVRKDEQSEVEDKKELFRKRKAFFVPAAKMTDEQAAEIALLSKKFPKTGRAFQIIACFDDFYRSKDEAEAEGAFKKLYSWMRRCRLEPMKKAAETLRNHKDNIMAYFNNRITNAISEGINSLIQAAKRKARGYRTFEGFSSMIYLVAGKLDLATPNPFRSIH